MLPAARLFLGGLQVLRVLPRVNDDVNEEWASDKTRHHVDALVRKRLDKPYVRKAGKLVEASWDEAYAAIAAVKHGGSGAAVAGDMLDCETLYRGRELVRALGGTRVGRRPAGPAYGARRSWSGGSHDEPRLDGPIPRAPALPQQHA